MKLTWFGSLTFRVQLGGSIVVLDAVDAPQGIDAAELVSGADLVISVDQGQQVDLETWRPRRPARLLDEAGTPQGVQTWNAGNGTMLFEAPGEPPLLILSETIPKLGRWASEAVVVLHGDVGELARLLLAQCAPRLIALAGSEADIDLAIPALRDLLDGTGLVALETGMALEV